MSTPTTTDADTAALLDSIDVAAWKFDDYASTITPAAAKKLLGLNIDRNRNVRTPAVKRLAQDMREGRFIETGATLSIDTTGHIIDGQHRLHACIAADVPFRTIIVSGLDPVAFTATDKGTKRTLGDTLKHRGVSNASRAAALSSALTQWDTDVRTSNVLVSGIRSEQEVLSYYTEHAEEIDLVAACSVVLPRVLYPKASDLVRVVTLRIDAEDSDVFFDALRSGRSDFDTLITMREALRRDREGSGKSRGAYWQLGMLLRTWNRWREGELDMTRAVMFTPGGSKANKLPTELV